MFVSGKTRGNAPQLSDYLLAMGENERIYVLDVDGRPHANSAHLKDMLYSMELNSELTRSNKSVYHAVIRPDPESQRDRAMTMEEWHRATEILAQSLDFENQRRATVLHEKDGYFHAHVVFERYDHDTGTMLDYKFNYQAHDNARAKMEREFSHERTPQKNVNKDEHKKTLIKIWKQAASGEQFIKEAQKNGYTVTKGTDRPFMVVDGNGRSFDLVRMLEGVKTKEVSEKLTGENLPDSKLSNEQTASPRQEKDLQQPPATEQTQAFFTPDKSNDRPEAASNGEPGLDATAVRERERQAFIEEIRKVKEQNERHNSLLQTFCIAAMLMLRVVVDRPFAMNRSGLPSFLQNKVSITKPMPDRMERRLGFVETAQFYKPT